MIGEEFGIKNPSDLTKTLTFTAEKQFIGVWGYKTSDKILGFGAITYDTTCDPQGPAPTPKTIVKIETKEIIKKEIVV